MKIKASQGRSPVNSDEERLVDLKRKLEAREGTPGYTANVMALKDEIARLEGTELEKPDRLADLKQKLAAREGKPGYHANVLAIRAEIARLEGREPE